MNFCNTVVVCAPNICEVMPSPNEAPKPSWRGRCISTIRMRRRQTRTSTTVKMPIKMSIGGGEYGGSSALGKCVLPLRPPILPRPGILAAQRPPYRFPLNLLRALVRFYGHRRRKPGGFSHRHGGDGDPR